MMRADNLRQNVVTEIVRAFVKICIKDQLIVEKFGIEQVITHRSHNAAGLAGYFCRLQRLFLKFQYSTRFINLHDTERSGRFFNRDFNAAHCHVGTDGFMGCNQRTIVHLVYMITAQHKYKPGFVRTDDIQILIDRIRCALIPTFIDPH